MIFKIAAAEISEKLDGQVKMKKGVVISSNFHRDCVSSYPNSEEVIKHIEDVKKDWECCQKKYSELFID